MKNNLTVLYVEDDELVRENFTQILQRYFETIIATDNGQTALELYEQQKPDIAILDISIPHLSGLQVATKIRKVDKKIQIIILTAYFDQNKLLTAVNLQLFAYLIKPIQQLKIDETLCALQKFFYLENILQMANDYSWNKKSQILYLNNQPIKITSNESQIIALMCHSPNRFYNACQIAQEILDDYDDKDLECNNIVQIISRFKKKILKTYSTDRFFIQNTYGSGYKIKLAS